MTIEILLAKYKQELSKIYTAEEANSISELVFTHLLDGNRLNLSLKKKNILSEEDQLLLQSQLIRLLKGEPPQYVLGETWFYGLRFQVNPSVLIPRPETEFLVDLIVKENANRPDLHLLDVCTGSGCIAIALKKNIVWSEVEAWDISNEAIKTAKSNSILNNSPVDFYEFDVLKTSLFPGHGPFDMIISNPPYVTEKEKTVMEPNVLNHEPHLALFVPDSDPLIFYKAIHKLSKNHLKKTGKIYFEINESYGVELSEYFQKAGFHHVKIIRDLYGRDRYLILETETVK